MFNLMDAPQRGALMLIRLIAVALIGWTVLELSFYVLDSRFHDHPVPILACVLWSLPFITGIIGLIKAKALAAWIADMLE
jgi:hypothetical protein